MGQQIDGELLRDGSVPTTKLEGGGAVTPGPDTVGAVQIIAGEAVAIRAKIGVDRAQAQGSDISASATLDLSSATGDFVVVNGTATVTAITLAQGKEATVRFTGAVTLTHNGATLILPGAADYVTVAGDVLVFRGLSAGVACVGLVKAAGPPRFSRFYESGPQVITAGGGLTLVHGLVVAPTLVQGFLVNVTAEAGFTAGHVVTLPLGQSGTNRGCSVRIDATNLIVRYGSDANTFQVAHATTGVTTALTNANWNLVVRAWAP